jgi:L-fuconolactonase
MRVDSHHHVWDLSVRPQDWMVGETLNPIKRNFFMDDLREQCQGTGIEKTIIVQTVTNYDETPELLELATEDDMIAGIIGFLKIDADDALRHLDDYAALEGYEYLVGIRDIAHDYPDPHYLSHPQVIKNCKELGERGFVYDLLTRTPQLQSGINLARACPETTFVLDHISKPYIADGVLEPWATLIRDLASLPNVYCKVSGMITEASWSNWKPLDFVPFFEILLNCFGPARLMFGSDWPVALLAGSYSEVVNLAEELSQSLSASEKKEFWSGTAIRAYGLIL